MKNVGKPKDIELRRDILSSFDSKPICDLADITEHLSKLKRPRPSHSIRYVTKKMVSEGLISIIERGPNNKAYYVKNMFSNATAMHNLNGKPVTLVQFITELDSLEIHPLLKDEVLDMMKRWMFNSIAIVDPNAYTDKKVPIPVARELKSNLEELRSAIEILHRYVKGFISTDIWSELGHRKMTKELESLGITSVLVDRYGIKPNNQESGQRDGDS